MNCNAQRLEGSRLEMQGSMARGSKAQNSRLEGSRLEGSKAREIEYSHRHRNFGMKFSPIDFITRYGIHSNTVRTPGNGGWA